MVTTTLSQTSYLHDLDVQLMLRVQDGDQDAFGELILNYQDRVIGICTHMLNDREAAEDIAQEVFLRVYRSKDRYEPKAKLRLGCFASRAT